MQTNYIGKPISRVDGRAKVTGAAKYAAEYNISNLAYGFVVSSTIAKGKITKIDPSAALEVPGVLQVFTHENRSSVAHADSNWRDDIAPPGSPFRPLWDNTIKFSGQPVALVVAEKFEIARYAASLVQVEYAPEPHRTDLDTVRGEAYEPPQERDGISPAPEPRGDAEKAYVQAAVRHEAEYIQPYEHHNPMELFGSTAIWEDYGKVTVYEKTQGPQNNQSYIAKIFGVSKDNVRVISSYVGGGFGSGLRPQYQLFLAVMASRELKRPVRVSLTRQQMFTFGYRPQCIQRIALGSSGDGKLEAFIHEAICATSQFEDFQENIVDWAGALYKCDNTKFTYKLAKLDLYTPIDMRAPGGATGLYAIECAVDELAIKLNLDPIELRLKNYTEIDQNKNVPFSSKELRECYRQGAEKIGWTKRNARPRSIREGHELIGYGMATGMWEANQQSASARAVLSASGNLEVSCATADIGTGTYTIMTQVAADLLGLPMKDVTFKLGDSNFPQAPVEGGSFTAATVGSAVKAACDAVREKIFKLAKKMEDSPFASATIEGVIFAEGQIHLKNDSSKRVSVIEAMRQTKTDIVEAEESSSPDTKKQEKYSRYTHSAIFAEVRVDEDLGVVRVMRVVNAVAAGRILNPKTARSQVLGGVLWGISMALEEESILDHRFGRFMTHNLADYHVPVNADIHDIDIIFVEERDSIVNPLGVKGLGEIGIVGTAAAIANAIFHATGKRIRDLPITLDKLL
jgi:xanthine dehydrogenase YagR molybdenum-binding subunit